MTRVSDAIEAWSAAADISARSVLVTIFGDAILPVTRTVWLSKLFELTAPFGFSQRLVRTSLSRLAGEGWVDSERIGRRSRYTLTPLAVRESVDADHRIYGDTPPAWDRSWTLVVVDHPLASQDERELLTRHLGWQGFVPLGRGVLASPVASVAGVRELLDLIEPSAHPPVAVAELVDLNRLVADGFFAAAFQTDEIESAYRAFVETYQPLLAPTSGSMTAIEAFAIRTMVVHDLRRIRLRAPDLPAELRPANWIGDEAYRVAAELYRNVEATSAAALGEILEMDYPAAIDGRFVSVPGGRTAEAKTG
ncbi:MAG: PaaX family transcriptional regulator C-terminal domain-containing protein [Acidimicrobiales bacterium]